MKKINLMSLFLTFASLIMASKAYPASFKLDIPSPDKIIHFTLETVNEQLMISATMAGKTVIEQSPLNMEVDGMTITGQVKPGKIIKSTNNTIYPVFGFHSMAKDNFNMASVPLTHLKSGLKYSLEIKVFNDAVAFRFIIPGDENKLRYPDESTIFKLAAGSYVWYHDLYMHYEGVHQKKLIDTIPEGQWAAPPLTLKLPGDEGYAAITEANLVNYAGMALQTDGRNGFKVRLGHSHPPSYPYVLRYSKEDVERLSRIAPVKGTIRTPWRVVIMGKDLSTLVNCDAITNLCEPPDKMLFPGGITKSWVKPGRAVWKYLDGGGDGTLSVMKKFSKEASELGFEYNILEGFWSRWPDDTIKALVDYSQNLGVKIIVWKHSNTLYDTKARQELFKRCHDLGIAGFKIDFFDHEAKEVTDLYATILREASALKLVLIFHGANKPTGLSRTWPNALIYEAVKGMESSKLADRATHETTIPFTRMLAGAADYSVCHFGDRRKNTTWAHQVATAAIFAAPVITYAASPEHILENPCAGMIKSIPAVWDETIVLSPSEIGELAIYAQRKGTTWFLSIINGLQPKQVKIPLAFLSDGNYNTLEIRDKEGDPADVTVSEKLAVKNNILSIDLAEGGGYISRFTLK